ncbi:MAG: hypothetical protein DCC67_16205 [Planctomycetota bacterium]|nr:MAG: hypothetical protein DCC67_16205 [Planctomycetota bacterium]
MLLQGARRPIPVAFKTRRVRLDETLRRTIGASIQSELGRFCRRVRHVFVWIEDANGPRDGSGVRCRFNLALHPRGRFVVAAEEANEHLAVVKCAARARERLDRSLKRARSAKRRTRAIH